MKAMKMLQGVGCGVGVLLLLAATAENVPQDSADKYCFTTPLHPGGIKGIVMGDPPEYRIMRSEDLSWLSEAYEERRVLLGALGINDHEALVPEFGKWRVSETNGYEKWTTAKFMEGDTVKEYIIARYAYKTNSLEGSQRRISRETRIETKPERITWHGDNNTNVTSIVLTGLGIAYSSDRVIENSAIKETTSSAGIYAKITNTMTVVVTNWNTRLQESHITGVGKGVHTNKWEKRTVGNVDRMEVWSERDARTDESMMGMMFKNGKLPRYEPTDPGNFEGVFSTKNIKKWYEVLKRAKYNCFSGNAKTYEQYETHSVEYWDKSTTVTEAQEYDQNYVDDIENYEDSEFPTYKEFTMQKGQWGSVGVSATRYASYKVRYTYMKQYYEPEDEYQGALWDEETGKGYDWVKADVGYGDIEKTISGQKTVAVCDSNEYDIYTDHPYDVVHTQGVNRIKNATLFAYVGVHWGEDSHSNYYDENGGSVEEWQATNRTFRFVKKIGKVREIEGGVEVVKNYATNKVVGFRCNIEMEALLGEAIAATGIKVTPAGNAPKLKYQVERPYLNKEGEDRYYWYGLSTSTDTTEYYGASMDKAVLIIEFDPWTSLDAWR